MRGRLLPAVLLGALAASCGYRLARSGGDPAGPFVVVSAPGFAPQTGLAAAAEAGLRAELARAGELSSCGPPGSIGCSAVVLELLRVEETSVAVGLPPSGPGSLRAPLAGAVRVSVTGRAYLRQGDVQSRATADLTASEVTARSDGPVAGGVAASLAGSVAARRLGEKLGRTVLGYPETTDE